MRVSSATSPHCPLLGFRSRTCPDLRLLHVCAELMDTRLWTAQLCLKACAYFVPPEPVTASVSLEAHCLRRPCFPDSSLAISPGYRWRGLRAKTDHPLTTLEKPGPALLSILSEASSALIWELVRVPYPLPHPGHMREDVEVPVGGGFLRKWLCQAGLHEKGFCEHVKMSLVP